MMNSWRERSPVAAAMLNPALVTAIVAGAAEAHAKETGRGMPWVLSFVVTPMVLHRGTRDALPTTTRTHLASWISQNPVVRAGFPARAQAMVEPVREGLRFGLAHGAVEFEDGGRLRSSYQRPRGFRMPEDLEPLLRKASLTGRWLSKSGSTATVFALLGVAP